MLFDFLRIEFRSQFATFGVGSLTKFFETFVSIWLSSVTSEVAETDFGVPKRNPSFCQPLPIYWTGFFRGT